MMKLQLGNKQKGVKMNSTYAIIECAVGTGKYCLLYELKTQIAADTNGSFLKFAL